MGPPSKTPEGDSESCSVCGYEFKAAPSRPPGDAPCPACGTLIWFSPYTTDMATELAALGTFIDTDARGEVVAVRLEGDAYDDSAIDKLATIRDVESIDIRKTRITAVGAAKLRELLPEVRIIYC